MVLTRAWLLLLLLSLGSTLIAWSGWAGLLPTLLILFLAWVKAQVILRVYLGLSQAPAWGRGFALALAFFMIAAIALTVAAGL